MGTTRKRRKGKLTIQDLTLLSPVQVIKTSSAANCTLKVSIQGCGVDIAEEAVTLTDAWAEYQSTAFTPSFAGFIKVILEVVDGSTTGDVGIDDIKVLIPA